MRISYQEKKSIEEYASSTNFCKPYLDLELLSTLFPTGIPSEILERMVYTLKHSPDGCTFLKNRHCTIYPQRPLDCRVYPFKIVILQSRHIFVGLADPSCPGLGRGDSVKEELERYALEYLKRIRGDKIR